MVDHIENKKIRNKYIYNKTLSIWHLCILFLKLCIWLSPSSIYETFKWNTIFLMEKLNIKSIKIKWMYLKVYYFMLFYLLCWRKILQLSTVFLKFNHLRKCQLCCQLGNFPIQYFLRKANTTTTNVCFYLQLENN